MLRNNFTDGVIIPLFQSCITGGLAGLFSGSAAAFIGVEPAALAGFAIGTGAALTAWVSYRGRWAWTIERLLRMDLNRDGTIGAPEELEEPEEPESVRVELIQDEGRRGDYIELPARPEQLRILADGLQNGRAFSQSVWTGNSGIFTRSEFEALRSELLRRGLAKWRKEGAPGQGIELTPPGRAVIRHFASETQSISPPPVG